MFGLVRRYRDGVLRAPGGARRRARARARGKGSEVGDDSQGNGQEPRSGQGADGDVLTAADLGEPLGERATLLQFSSAFCAPCRATRRVLGEVAEMVDGVSHVELDAEAHLALVRRFNVLRTPTVLVLDREGNVLRRASGQPRKADVIAALGAAIS
ncbi:thioredoxin [Actinomadura sp. J1-007]|nr:thioredoxin [Actinomadura sp. J1-007]